ncbi:MAG: hypothetical protein LQ337_008655 [Flavoplaca oasis]|nr:MAG: hypothetical protein LQ337_008655 [Flavoplaca oasis]
MPQLRTPSAYRPQTSRQAKRAYQKAGATPRISAVEQRRIDRAVELEDRAARIRLHNVRARENKRKKAEKDEKDRELRKRMGIQEPSKFKIGPSQQSLGAFVGVGLKHKKLEPVEDEVPECSSPYTPTEDTKTEVFSVDCPEIPEKSEKPDWVTQENVVVPSDPLESCCDSRPKIDRRTNLPPKEVTTTKTVLLTTLMPPPPPRLSSNTKVSKPAPPTYIAPSNPIVAAAAIDSDWDMFLDSNTQVAREISYHPIKASTKLVDQKSPSATTVQHSTTSVDLLAGISTQDLQYCSSPLAPKPNFDNEAEFLGGIEDEDLSDVNIAGFFESSDPAGAMTAALPPSSQQNQSTTALHKGRWPTTCKPGAIAQGKDTAAFNRMDEFDDSEFSSQELRQLVV